ncbi:aminopeptidase [Treponema sp.]|uniref:aminopeptidase n=1 Tax=Treponema sp. TaxID=166 RepID=UPI003FA1A7F4
MTTIDYEKIKQTAVTVIRDVCALQKGERVLIITNPEDETLEISRRLYEAADELGGKAVIVMQKTKTLLDFAEPEVIVALHTEPDICLSVSANKLGKDEAGSKNPFVAENGEEFNHIFNYNFEGKKNMRAIWTPGITIDMFIRAANINYALLQKRCRILADKFRNASYVHVTAPGGTDIKVPVRGRTAFCDDGDFSKPGNGGNIPAGEVFISPLTPKTSAGCEGRIVFDGSISVTEGCFIITDPIIADVKGYVSSITSKAGRPVDGSDPDCEAYRLLRCITAAENQALQMEKEGRLPAGAGAEYARNARNIGELGIGLNPAALITGKMLEDEKAFKTCHFAIGSNYDNDARSLIHFDGVVRNPTITIHYEDGSEFTVEKDGELCEELQ